MITPISGDFWGLNETIYVKPVAVWLACAKCLLRITFVRVLVTKTMLKSPQWRGLCLRLSITLNQVTFFLLLHLGNPFTTENSVKREQCGARVACGCLKPVDTYSGLILIFAHAFPSLIMLRHWGLFVSKSHCLCHRALRTLVLLSITCYRALINALCFPFVWDPGPSGDLQLFGGTSFGRSMKKIFLFTSVTLCPLPSSKLRESCVENTHNPVFLETYSCALVHWLSLYQFFSFG